MDHPEPETALRRTVAMVTLGCARNEVDSEELAGRLAAEGWDLVEDAAAADAVVVNTCGFVDAAKKDSIDTILAAADLKAEQGSGARGPQAVVAVGCLAERYGKDLASELPEADAVLGFDDYPQIAAKLTSIISGQAHVPHAPRDRRLLLPISPAERRADGVSIPGHGVSAAGSHAGGSHAGGASGAGYSAAESAEGPTVAWNDVRRRLGTGPVAALKLASGCDRRCSFCAIPTFRGAFISRRPHEVLDEAAWLAGSGVREAVLVSENSTSYGKDLGDIRLLESLLPEFEGTGLSRVRVSYLQPAEMRPTLVAAIAGTPVVADYFDLSFQHASASVLRRMRRFGDPDSFLELLASIRRAAPAAGVRSNVIVGFPGETDAEFAELCAFLEAAGLDAIGVFGYSDEDGTEAESFGGKLPEDEIRARVEHVTALAEELTNQRAIDRIGDEIEVLIEAVEGGAGQARIAEGRAAHQGPDDGASRIDLGPDGHAAIGDMVRARVVDAEGIDLVAERIAP